MPGIFRHPPPPQLPRKLIPPAAGATCYRDVVIADAPVAYWRLGEASGNPQDSVGTNHVTTVGGTPTYGVTGALSGDASTAITFDGSTEYLRVPDATALDLGNAPLTFELWLKRSATSASYHIPWAKGSQGNLFFNNNKFALDADTGGQIVEESGTTTDFGWHHWAVSRTATGAGGTKLYKDGANVTVEGAGIGNALSSSAIDFFIGVYRDLSLHFAGSIDEVAIYNTALSGAQILAHYDAAPISCDAGGSVSVTPGVASLALTAFAPTVTATAHVSVTPAPASLTLATFAPTVGIGVNVTPTTAALTLTAFAPTVAVSDNKLVTPGTATLTLASFAPTVSTPRLVIPTTAALTLTGFAPTVSATAHVTVTPATASLILATFAPSVVGGAGLTVVPGVAGLTLTGFAPSVSTTSHQTVTPGLATLGLATFAPVVTATDHKVVTPLTASLFLSAFAPVVTATGGVIPSGPPPIAMGIRAMPRAN